MFNFTPPSAIKATLIAASLTLSAFSLNAQAALTSYTNAGTDLVYSSVSNVTWTKDANLMQTLMGSQTTTQWATLLNGVGGNSGLVASDFNTNGTATWKGANAYINYLNSINYGGSNQWYLPTVANTTGGFNTATNGTAKGDELVELFYRELNGTPGNAIQDPQNKFINEQSSAYWFGTEYAQDPIDAWVFYASFGVQSINSKSLQFYAWAVSPGRINTATPSAVPVPAAAWLFGSGLLGVMGLRRRKHEA